MKVDGLEARFGPEVGTTVEFLEMPVLRRALSTACEYEDTQAGWSLINAQSGSESVCPLAEHW